MHFRYILRFWTYVDNRSPHECWLWTGCTDGMGRPVYSATVNGEHYQCKAYRFAFWEAHGRWPVGKLILHSCDEPLCCNPAHLREGSQAENMGDAVTRGRTESGSKHHLAKLTEADIPVIRRLRAEGWSCAAIAKRFGVSDGPIKAIMYKGGWKHVK